MQNIFRSFVLCFAGVTQDRALSSDQLHKTLCKMSMRAADVVQSDNIILSSERNVFSTEEYGYSDVLRYKTRRFQGGGRITLVWAKFVIGWYQISDILMQDVIRSETSHLCYLRLRMIFDLEFWRSAAVTAHFLAYCLSACVFSLSLDCLFAFSFFKCQFI